MTVFALSSRAAFMLITLSVALAQPARAQDPSSSMAPMPLVAPLFIENRTTSSMITMVSNSTTPMTVDVILLDLSGSQLGKGTLVLGAHEHMSIQGADLLDRQSRNAQGVVGSVVLSATGNNWPSLAAQLSMTVQHGSQAPAFLEEEFLMLSDMGNNRLRSVAVEVSAPPALALRNLSNATQSISVTCIVQDYQLVTNVLSLGPGEASVSQVCGAQGLRTLTGIEGAAEGRFPSAKAVGISVSGTGTPGSLAVYGISAGKNNKAAYSAFQFSQTSTTLSASTVFAGLPVCPTTLLAFDSFQPDAAVTNFGTTPRR